MSCWVFPLPRLELLHSPPTRAPTTPHRQPLPWRQMTNAARPTALTETTRSASYSVPRVGMAVPYGRTLAGSGRESKTRESTLALPSEPLLKLAGKWLVGKPMSPGNRIFPVFHLDNGEDHIPWEIRAVLLQVLGTSSPKHVSEIRRNCFNKLLR